MLSVLVTVASCGEPGQVGADPLTTESTVAHPEVPTATPVDTQTEAPTTTAGVPRETQPSEFRTLEELGMVLSPFVDLSQLAGITSYRFRSVRRGETETGWWVVEGAVDDGLPATLLRIDDPEQGVFYFLYSGERFWQAGPDQVFEKSEPPMEWPLFWPIPSYGSATNAAATILESGPEVVGIEEIGEISVQHLRSLVEGSEGNLWVDRDGVLIRLEFTLGEETKSGYYFELYDINGDIEINLPP